MCRFVLLLLIIIIAIGHLWTTIFHLLLLLLNKKNNYYMHICVQSMKDAHAPSTSTATLYKKQSTFIRYLDIYLSSLQHLLNHFHSLLFFCQLLKNIREVKRFYSWKKHTQRFGIYRRRILVAGCNKTIALKIFYCDKNDTSDSN